MNWNATTSTKNYQSCKYGFARGSFGKTLDKLLFVREILCGELIQRITAQLFQISRSRLTSRKIVLLTNEHKVRIIRRGGSAISNKISRSKNSRLHNTVNELEQTVVEHFNFQQKRTYLGRVYDLISNLGDEGVVLPSQNTTRRKWKTP